MKTHILKILIFGFATFFSCKKDSIEAQTDDQKLVQLKADIETFASNKACSSGDNCRVIGIGSQPCGGPSGYVIYSLSNTDEKQLMVKVNDYTELQKANNLKKNTVGICIVLAIPMVDCRNGLCSAK